MTTPHTRFYVLAALILAIFSFALSALVSRTVFERLPHLEDEVAYLFQARIFARGDIVGELPTPYRPYWQPFVIEHSTGTRFGKYPPGWPGLLAVGVLLGQEWLINAFFAALTVALVYRLGAEIFSRDAGLIAAFLTAFSPMALLLNGTLMGHTSALFFATLFMYAYWRVCRFPVSRGSIKWAVLAGLSLGMVAINRPLTAVAIALPFVVYSVLRLLLTLRENKHFLRVLRPLAVLAVAALLVCSAVPLFNYAATGDPTVNLYTLWWPYDRVGFGAAQEFGINGHSLIKGVQFARYDLSLTAADLFGWQLGVFEPETPEQRRELSNSNDCNSYAPMRLQVHLRTCSGYWRVLGISWLLLPFGLAVGFGLRRWVWVWLAAGVVWIAVVDGLILTELQNPNAGQIELWAVYGIFWVFAPLAFLFHDFERKAIWTWLLFGVVVLLIAVHFAYWVGSQRYTTRYYFEALTAAALLSALPLGWVIDKVRLRSAQSRGMANTEGSILSRTGGHAASPRQMKNGLGKTAVFGVYGLLLVACLWSLYAYSTPRITALTGFNRVTRTFIEAVEARRQTDQPLLVLATGAPPVRWRATGALMALTSPYLDSDIVAAWDSTQVEGIREQILARFPEREVLEIGVHEEDAWWLDACPPGLFPPDCPVINP